ncbi:Hypothetical predicted protein [Mytilus galloprovincialis]|uniref:Uncharacterized protein n=1 Tax=Mytilus galloprovincialis TaxID=29158 RepID=A0A8B6BKE5_MYTGA|nr:Hypothetical predicted protein [Mytilus galloprovincialis]
MPVLVALLDAKSAFDVVNLNSLHRIRINQDVRTRTVTLYLKYCEETPNADILSERTYMRLFEAIGPNVRKSMKDLDNFAADGSQAFDNLKSVVVTLGKGGKGQECAEKISSWKGSSI